MIIYIYIHNYYTFRGAFLQLCKLGFKSKNGKGVFATLWSTFELELYNQFVSFLVCFILSFLGSLKPSFPPSFLPSFLLGIYVFDPKHLFCDPNIFLIMVILLHLDAQFYRFHTDKAAMKPTKCYQRQIELRLAQVCNISKTKGKLRVQIL